MTKIMIISVIDPKVSEQFYLRFDVYHNYFKPLYVIHQTNNNWYKDTKGSYLISLIY